MDIDATILLSSDRIALRRAVLRPTPGRQNMKIMNGIPSSGLNKV
jgi:hypothetical protein